MRHWLILVLGVCLLLPACSSLILRDDDTTGQTVGKVTARTLLIVPTLFWSEAFIAQAKNEELRQQQLLEQYQYVSALCEKEGFALGQVGHDGCVSMKMGQSAQQAGPNIGVIMQMPTQQRLQSHCFTSSSGRSTTCY